MLEPEVGYRLAALIDGEGCFVIGRSRPKNSTGNRVYYCSFALLMRADDREILERFHEATGLGKVRVYGRSPVQTARGSNPLAHWRIERKGDCLELVRILDEYPLWSKKARDYAIWREAVLYVHGPRPEGRAPLERWFHEIRSIRQYVEGDLPLPVEEILLTQPLFEVGDESG